MRTTWNAATIGLLATACAGGAGALVAAGCGDDDNGATTPKVDPPAKAPDGFRTIVNREAGLTVAVPRRWRARPRGEVTVLRSPGRTVAITIAADRGPAGRDTAPSQYARSTLEALPGFEGSIAAGGRQVDGTPYSSGLVTARGTIDTSPREQQIAVAALQVPGQATFAATVFGADRPRVIEQILASVRAGAAEAK